MRLFVLHTNSVLQGTYRQLMCFRLEAAKKKKVISLREQLYAPALLSRLTVDRRAFERSVITNIKAAIEEKYCAKRAPKRLLFIRVTEAPVTN